MNEPKCTTCGEEYRKEMTFCSNPFHCCKDCIWLDGVRTSTCLECELQEAADLEEWTRRNRKDERTF